MQTKQILFWCFFGIFSLCRAQTFQNIVPNGSFETYTQCPTAASQIYHAFPWTGPTTNSTDYYNACSTIMNVPHYGNPSSTYPFYLEAKTGVAFAGIYTFSQPNAREYAQVELVDTLKSGSCYYVEFYASNIQALVKYKTNNIAANFSSMAYPVNLLPPGTIPNATVHVTNYNNPVLEDTVKWQKISGIYTGTGVEKYIAIGNFKDDAHTDTVNIYQPGTSGYNSFQISYVYIDAVSVFSIDPNGTLPWSYSDTSIYKGDSVYIGNKMGGMNFHPKWYTIGGSYITTNAGITVSPTVTSSYVIQYTLCGVPRADTIQVNVLQDVGFEKFKIIQRDLKLFPNPADNILQFTVDVENEFKTISIYNKLGQLLREEEITFQSSPPRGRAERGLATIKTDELENGVYVLKLHGTNSQTVSKRFIINR